MFENMKYQHRKLPHFPLKTYDSNPENIRAKPYSLNGVKNNQYLLIVSLRELRQSYGCLYKTLKF